MKQVEQTETLGFTAIQVDEPRHQHHGDRGGGDRVRTDDPLLAKQVLSQLSYAPWNSLRGIFLGAVEDISHQIWWAREDLNLRPHAYQACALTS